MQEYLGPEIISHFVMHGTGVAEIVKHLITVLKKKDADLSNIFLEALKRVSLMTAVEKFHLVKDADLSTNLQMGLMYLVLFWVLSCVFKCYCIN